MNHFLLIIYVLSFFVYANDFHKLKVKALRIEEKITIDGILNENIWKKDHVVSGLKQRDPVEGADASQKTEIYVAYDDDNLYVAACLYDTNPDSIVARLGRRDHWLDSDLFGVFIDPYYDKRSGFYFGLNAAGTYYDGVLYNDDWDDDSWDGVWEGKSQINENGWCVEMRIPFSQLRFQKKEKYVWGINFLREITRNNEEDYLVYKPKNESGFVSRFVDLTGLEQISPSRNFEILPYSRVKQEYLQKDKNNPFYQSGQQKYGLGVDMKLGLSTNLTLDATINPDFGQVEVDPAVVNLGDVETFFQEKRPFFIEGSTIFDFGYGGATSNWGFNWSNPQIFYSRRIGRAPQGNLPDNVEYFDRPEATTILGAAKITGKLGNNWNVGLLTAVTEREYADITYENESEKNETEIEPLTFYSVFRAQKEFNDGRQGLGIINSMALRNFKDNRLDSQINKNAYTVGIDGWTFLDNDKVYVINGWFGLSQLRASKEQLLNIQQNSRHYFQRPDFEYLSLDSSATSLTGFAGRIALNKQKGNWILNSAIGVVDPRFDVNDLGFMWRTNMINGHFGGGYKWTEPGKFFRRVTILSSLFMTKDFDGNTTWGGIWSNFNFSTLDYYFFEIGGAYNPQTTNNNRTRGGPLTINKPGYELFSWFSTDSRKKFVFGAGGYTYISKAPSESFGFELDLEWKPEDNFSVSVNPEFDWDFPEAQWVTSYDDPTADETFGRRYVFANLDYRQFSLGTRINWTFTPELSFQVYIQPLISTGNYYSYKYLARSNSYQFNNFSTQKSEIRFEDGEYTVDADGNGPAPDNTFNDRDFKFTSLRGNAVLRWEYLPGSALYFVWTQSRTDFDRDPRFQFSRPFPSRFLDRQPDNIFLVKMTYWMNI